MSDPLRNDRDRTAARGDDLGDVLASIRRLIAQDGGQSGAQFDRPAGPSDRTTDRLPGRALDALSLPVERPGPLRLDAAARTGSADTRGAPVEGPAAMARRAWFDPPPTAPLRPAPQPQPQAERVKFAEMAMTSTGGAATEPMGDSPALQDHGPGATGRPPGALSPSSTAALTQSLAEAVDQASARMAAATRQIEAARAPEIAPEAPAQDEAPFRLEPDALIPPALIQTTAKSPATLLASPVEAEPVIRPPVSLSLIAPAAAGTGAGPSSAPPMTTDAVRAPDRDESPDAAALAWSADAGHHAEQIGTSTAPADDDLASPTPIASSGPKWASPVDAPSCARLPLGAASLTAHPECTDAETSHAAPEPGRAALPQPLEQEPTMDAHPLRNMLRDAIREELRGEFADRIDSDLRRIVREELAAALTEAFGHAPA